MPLEYSTTLDYLEKKLDVNLGSANDTQVGGDHYRKKSVQPWDAMQSWMTPEQFSGYLLGGTFKYLARYREKGGVVDLEKGRHTLDKLIEVEKEIGAKKP